MQASHITSTQFNTLKPIHKTIPETKSIKKIIADLCYTKEKNHLFTRGWENRFIPPKFNPFFIKPETTDFVYVSNKRKIWFYPEEILLIEHVRSDELELNSFVFLEDESRRFYIRQVQIKNNSLILKAYNDNAPSFNVHDIIGNHIYTKPQQREKIVKLIGIIKTIYKPRFLSDFTYKQELKETA